MNDKVHEGELEPAETIGKEPGQSVTLDRPQETAVAISPYLGMIQTAIDKDIDIGKLEKLVLMADGFERKEANKSLLNALSLFQSNLPTIEKKGHVSYPGRGDKPGTEFSHARLEDITEAVRPHLAANRLSYRFESSQELTGEFNTMAVIVKCIVSHSDGGFIENSGIGYPDTSGSKNNIQAVASTTTYLKRQTLTGALGIAAIDSDDDGNMGGEPGAAPVATQQQDRGPEGGQPPPQEEVTGGQMTDEKFQQLLPAWKKMIDSGDKTPADILAGAKKRNFILSPEQVKQLTA